MPGKKRVLFVDDEPHVLDGLRRMLGKMRDEWEMEFATSGAEALAALAKHPFDIIVTDMRMPVMNGAQLLNEVKVRYPGIVRFILSGHSNLDLIMRSAGSAHQYLAKPCDAEMLTQTVRRSYALRDLLNDRRLGEILSGITTLPVLPGVYSQLVQALADEKTSPAEVGRIVSQDVGMTAKVLQLINSAFFGVRRRVEDPAQAVFYIGLDAVRGLVLSVGVFSQFTGLEVPDFSIEALHRHCLDVGARAKQIATRQGASKQFQGDTFIGGVLHDVGTLILVANFAREFQAIRSLSGARQIPMIDAEREVLGATHAELGGYLLGLWGLPDPVVEAVAFHHSPRSCLNREFSPLTAVHVANGLAHEQVSGEAGNGAELVDREYLAELGLVDRLPKWKNELEAGLKQREESYAECVQ